MPDLAKCTTKLGMHLNAKVSTWGQTNECTAFGARTLALVVDVLDGMSSPRSSALHSTQSPGWDVSWWIHHQFPGQPPTRKKFISHFCTIYTLDSPVPTRHSYVNKLLLGVPWLKSGWKRELELNPDECQCGKEIGVWVAYWLLLGLLNWLSLFFHSLGFFSMVREL